MKCILHIGTEKTGTSSLQEFLHQNRKILAAHGYLYTKSVGLRNNQSLSIAAYNTDRRDNFTRSRGIYDDRDLIAYQNAKINALRVELKHAKGMHTVIFSSEQIQSRLRTDDEISRLKNILNGLGFDQISIVVYLRAPEEIANSLYSTVVKVGSTNANPPGPGSKYWHNLCDHRKTLMRFRNIFGLEAIVPRIYSKAELVNGSIIDDFIETVGLPYSMNEYVIPKPQNESMTVLGVEILRRINLEIPMFLDGQKPNPLRGDIESYVLEHLNDGARYAMPMDLRRQYEDAFMEGNEWVRSEYFPDRKSLFESNQIPCVSDSGFQPSELDQIAQMISAIWLDKTSGNLGFYKNRSFQIVYIIWRLKRKILWITKNLTSRWRRM